MAKTVLIVDSDASFSASLEVVCKACGLDVVSATDGESGLMAFTFEHPDLVVLETTLPDRPGLTLAKQIRGSDGGEVPMVLTGNAADAKVHAAQAAAIAPTAVIGKPVDYDKLGEALARLSDGDASAIAKLDLGGLGNGAAPSAAAAVLTSPAQADDVSMSGSLDTTPFPELFAGINTRGETGVLELARGRVRKAVFFKDGVPFFARSNAVNELLGNVLLKLKKINKEQLDKSVALMKKTKRQQGEILVEMGAITEAELKQGLKAQVRAKIYNLFGWDEGTFQFHQTDKFPAGITKLTLRPSRILNQGIRQRYKIDRLRPIIASLLTKTVKTKGEAKAYFENAKLTDPEWGFLSKLDGQRTLAEVLAASDGIEEGRAAQLVFMLHVSKKLEVGEAAPEAPELILSDELPEVEAPPTSEPVAAPAAPSSEDVKQKVTAEAARLNGLNHFEVLSVTPDAANAEIKANYFRLAKEWHPDRFADADPETRLKADEVFSKIGEAHATLTDADARKKYTDEVIHGISDDASEEANAILNAEHQFLKGERLLDAGNTEKALEAFATALELYPKEGEYHAYYGWALWKLNTPNNKARADEGERKIRESLKLNPMNGRAHYFLGYIHRFREEFDDARRQFERALELQPDNLEAQRELRLLERRQEKKGLGGLFSRFKK